MMVVKVWARKGGKFVSLKKNLKPFSLLPV